METLIVYYSRSGATEKVARDIAVRLNADELSLEDNRDRSGILGFLRSGFDALTSNVTVINDFDHRLEEYDLIIIGTPMWAGRLTPAVRTFLLGNAEVLPEVAFFITRGGTSAERTLLSMEDLAGREPLASLVLNRQEAMEKTGSSREEIESFVSLLSDKVEGVMEEEVKSDNSQEQ